MKPNPPILRKSKLRDRYPSLKQEDATRIVYSRKQLDKALEQARLGKVKEIVIADDISIDQTITLDIEGLTLTSVGEAEILVTTSLTSVFDLGASFLRVDGLRIIETDSGTISNLFLVNSDDGVIGDCIVSNNYTDMTDGYLVNSIDDLLVRTVIDNNVCRKEAKIEGKFNKCKIHGNSGAINLSITLVDDSNTGYNAITSNICLGGNVDTSAGDGYNTIVGNVDINSLTTHANDASAGNS